MSVQISNANTEDDTRTSMSVHIFDTKLNVVNGEFELVDMSDAFDTKLNVVNGGFELVNVSDVLQLDQSLPPAPPPSPYGSE